VEHGVGRQLTHEQLDLLTRSAPELVERIDGEMAGRRDAGGFWREPGGDLGHCSR
jgi:hypothetical protein